jgi:thiamine pyrophosphokinase
MVTVVCTGGEVPPTSLSLSWLDAGQRTIAADGGLAMLKNWGRKADLWIGDGDSLPGDLADWSPWYTDTRVLDPNKDDSDTDAAVKAALDGGAREVWLLGGSGGRMDHWWANLRLIAGQPALTRWLTRHEEIWNLGPGDDLAVVPGTVSIFPLGSGPWKLRSTGFQWPLDAVDFRQWHSLSNQAVGAGAKLHVETGRFLVLRPLEFTHE